MHDIGKALIDPSILKKTNDFTEEDHKSIIPHVVYGYFILRGVFDYTANIVVRHHRHGRNPYPETLPILPDDLKPHLEAIDEAGRLLALADFYDALTTRKNDKHGSVSLTSNELRDIFYRDNSDMEPLIRKLEQKEILKF